MRIAALDDDALQLDLIKQATEAMGHVCHTHLTGAELMRTLRRETFDLLIVDWHLPDTTGPEVVRWVRKNVGTQLPILFVTHRQEERDIVEGLGSGADDFMVKPVRIGIIREVAKIKHAHHIPAVLEDRIAEVIDWQIGAFGGQALASYQTVAPDNAAKYKDTSVGGRVSYGVARNVKVLVDVGITSRAIDGQATQRLNKGTLALAFSPDNKFWTRPEFRVYLSRFNWNSPAAAANAATFGAGGRTSATTVGAQVEYWW